MPYNMFELLLLMMPLLHWSVQNSTARAHTRSARTNFLFCLDLRFTFKMVMCSMRLTTTYYCNCNAIRFYSCKRQLQNEKGKNEKPYAILPCVVKVWLAPTPNSRTSNQKSANGKLSVDVVVDDAVGRDAIIHYELYVLNITGLLFVFCVPYPLCTTTTSATNAPELEREWEIIDSVLWVK